MKKKIGLVISLAISGIAIFWLIQRVNLREVEQAMKQINYFCWFSAALIYLLGFLPRGLRWQLMLSTIKKVSLADSTQIVALGYAANNVLPFRLGEVVRAYIMGNKNNISKITCLASIATERVIDGIVLVSLLGLSMIFLSVTIQSAEALKHILFTCGAIFLSAVFIMVLVLIFSEKALQIGKSFFGHIGVEILEKLIHSLSFLRTKKILFNIVLLSIIVWLIEGAMFVLILWEMGLRNPVTGGYFCMGIVNMGILLPSAPGYVGVYQAASVFAFLALGYSESAGLAYGLLVHIAQYIPITIIGGFIFIHFQYRFSEFYKTILRTS
jgi:uncharacterized protein (TIRG00374 family)